MRATRRRAAVISSTSARRPLLGAQRRVSRNFGELVIGHAREQKPAGTLRAREDRVETVGTLEYKARRYGSNYITQN